MYGSALPEQGIDSRVDTSQVCLRAFLASVRGWLFVEVVFMIFFICCSRQFNFVTRLWDMAGFVWFTVCCSVDVFRERRFVSVLCPLGHIFHVFLVGRVRSSMSARVFGIFALWRA